MSLYDRDLIRGWNPWYRLHSFSSTGEDRLHLGQPDARSGLAPYSHERHWETRPGNLGHGRWSSSLSSPSSSLSHSWLLWLGDPAWPTWRQKVFIIIIIIIIIPLIVIWETRLGQRRWLDWLCTFWNCQTKQWQITLRHSFGPISFILKFTKTRCGSMEGSFIQVRGASKDRIGLQHQRKTLHGCTKVL